MIDFQTSPDRYRHWKIAVDGDIATLSMDVQEDGGLMPGYELKLNSYDLGVDIELYDAIQRLRFEHPSVKAVILTSAKERVFCAGANIKMLSGSTHNHKVNFCKFTNETRNAIEDASRYSGQTYLTAINGPCAGGGYELALSTEFILMADDGNTAVSLPELPLLAVLPGTGGLTRLVDKRHVRRDRADFFCMTEEGVKGQRAVDWRLVDDVAPRSRLMARAHEQAKIFAAQSDRPQDAKGLAFPPLTRRITDDQIIYPYVSADIDRTHGSAHITINGPESLPSAALDPSVIDAGFWPLAMARALDDLILHLRANETEIGTWVFHTIGDNTVVAAYDAFLHQYQKHWLIREVLLFYKRVLKRLDVSSRSLLSMIEPGSCFCGSLLELVLASDQSYMLDGMVEGKNQKVAEIRLTELNFGAFPMVNGLTRLESRNLDQPTAVLSLKAQTGVDMTAENAIDAGLVTFAPDDIDWEDEVRLAVETRAAFSPDGLTGLEANLRFGGPETMESKIFARLSAWQNWIFQRPNAVGENGALKLYGSGKRAQFDKRRA